FIDFDRFKIINDTYGHDVGDELLRLAGKRLSRVMEGREVVARLGGDEFLFVSTLDAPLDIESVITRLRSTRSAPFRINHLHIDIDYSIGVAIYPDDGQTISELMRAADSAMYYAKLHGDDYCVYTHSADMKNLPLH
ncbi:MAG: diguanylate cyclase domain-containing protein, partial [Vibrio sp.]